MAWTSEQIDSHRNTAVLLGEIMRKTFEHIKKRGVGITEFEVQEFILNESLKRQLEHGKTLPRPIVTFGENTAIVHHFPSRGKAKKLKRGMVVLVDIFVKAKGRQSPFADITWTAYYGNYLPRKVERVFSVVIKARDASIRFIRQELRRGNLPVGREVDAVALRVIESAGFGDFFVHSLGHVLGTYSCHGIGRQLDEHDDKPLEPGLAYTIEPGIYIEGAFGIRSEMNFLITPNLGFEIITSLQKKIVRISSGPKV